MDIKSDQYRQIRDNLNLSQTEFARAMGITRQTLIAREYGRSKIGAEAIMALAWLANGGDLASAAESLQDLLPVDGRPGGRTRRQIKKSHDLKVEAYKSLPPDRRAEYENPELPESSTAGAAPADSTNPQLDRCRALWEEKKRKLAMQAENPSTPEPQEDNNWVEVYSVDDPECWRIYGLAPGGTTETCLDGWKGQLKNREVAESRIPKLVSMGCKSMIIKGEKLI